MTYPDVPRRRSPRKVLVASKFLHHVGGVETYIAWLARHLSAEGIEVGFFGMTPPAGRSLMPEVTGPTFLSPNRDYYGSWSTTLRSAAASVYSTATADVMREAIDTFQPDLVHFQSTCYQLTPSVVSVAARRGVPMVTTAHEYKFVCSNQRLWDDGRMSPCTMCVGESTAPRIGHMIRRRCVKGSLGSSVVAAVELPVSNWVWRRAPGLVHAPSHFIAGLLDGSGSPVRGRVRYLDLAWGECLHTVDNGSVVRQDVVYIGRLSAEKGVDRLIAAWPAVAARRPDVRLMLFGAGADEERLRGLAAAVPGIEFRGGYDRAELPLILSSAAMTVHPSAWAENSPYTVRESLQHGVPAIVSDQGGLPEMVGRRTGTIVPSDDVSALSRAILDELDTPRAARADLLAAVERRFVSDAAHVKGLMDIYDEAASITEAGR